MCAYFELNQRHGASTNGEEKRTRLKLFTHLKFLLQELLGHHVNSFLLLQLLIEQLRETHGTKR